MLIKFSNKTDRLERYRASDYYYFPSERDDLVIGWYKDRVSTITLPGPDVPTKDEYINHLTGRWLKRSWGPITFNAFYRFVKDVDLVVVCDPDPVAVILPQIS